MELNLAGKRALVTGSSSGIGASAARLLAAEKAKVVVHGRNADRAQAIAAEIKAAGGEAAVALGDLTTDEGAAAVAEAALAHWGGIDILVNNAGGPSSPTLTWDTITSADWIRTYELNTLSAIRMVHHCLPGMKQVGWGRIIQISSLASIKPGPNNIPDYGSAKATLIVLSVGLAKTLAGTGITVNTISPGLIITPVLEDYILSMPVNAGKTLSELEPALAESWNSLVGRLGTPEDVGAMITFLASPVAGFITGANFRVDGGMSGFINA